MRVVLDTNVLISALFFAGLPGRILGALVDERFDLLASLEILTEYRQVVARLERQFPSVEAQPLLDLVIRNCHLVEPAPVPRSACDDSDDLKSGVRCGRPCELRRLGRPRPSPLLRLRGDRGPHAPGLRKAISVTGKLSW